MNAKQLTASTIRSGKASPSHSRVSYIDFLEFTASFSRTVRYRGVSGSLSLGVYHKAVQLVFVRLIRTLVTLEVGMEGICVFILIVFIIMSRSEATIPPKIAVVVVPESSVGSEATLICSLASGTKPVHFSWIKDGHEIPSKLMTNQPTSSTLVIPVVKSEDRGRYTCFVKSSFGEDSKSADLVVSGQFSIDLN